MYLTGDDGKVNCSKLEKCFNEYGIPHEYTTKMFKLLYLFELAVPLDSNTLLLPFALYSDPQDKLYRSINCSFPCKNITLPEKVSCGVHLYPTGMCYRRLFVANNIPNKFWLKLIPQFISSSERFYNILVNNCIKGMTLEKMANVSDAVIGNHHCKCFYWKNGITVRFGDEVLFSVNGLMQSRNTCDNTHKIPISVTTDKIKTLKIVDKNTWKQLFPKDIDGDGIEVKVPDYVVISRLEENGEIHKSNKLGPQILANVLDVLNELCITMFKGDLNKGIYTQSYFNQVVVCSYCYGDTPVTVADPAVTEVTNSLEMSLHSLHKQRISTVNYATELNTNSEKGGCYGFSIKICILEAQKHGFVHCPNHGKLHLLYLTPDLVCKLLYICT